MIAGPARDEDRRLLWFSGSRGSSVGEQKGGGQEGVSRHHVLLLMGPRDGEVDPAASPTFLVRHWPAFKEWSTKSVQVWLRVRSSSDWSWLVPILSIHLD